MCGKSLTSGLLHGKPPEWNHYDGFIQYESQAKLLFVLLLHLVRTTTRVHYRTLRRLKLLSVINGSQTNNNNILSWGFKSDRIFKLQKRAVRIITCSKYSAHREPWIKTLNLLKIEDIMKTKPLKLYYRYKQNELPKYFESMFTESDDNLSHDTRHKSVLYKLPTKTSTGRLYIRHYIPELLSKTPECLTEKLDTHSFSGFSNYMKNYYIRNYNESCLIEKCYVCQK